MIKTLLITMTAMIGLSAEVSHPNDLAALPAPTITYETNLDTLLLEQQYPQGEIYNEGGLIGYFSRIPNAPIWTTPAVFHRDKLIDHPLLWIHWVRENCDDVPPASVPEPSAYIMAGVGLLMIAFRAKYW